MILFLYPTSQHLDQSLRLHGTDAEPFFGRPFSFLASCEEVEWRLKRKHVLRGMISTEGRC